MMDFQWKHFPIKTNFTHYGCLTSSDTDRVSQLRSSSANQSLAGLRQSSTSVAIKQGADTPIEGSARIDVCCAAIETAPKEDSVSVTPPPPPPPLLHICIMQTVSYLLKRPSKCNAFSVIALWQHSGAFQVTWTHIYPLMPTHTIQEHIFASASVCVSASLMSCCRNSDLGARCDTGTNYGFMCC